MQDALFLISGFGFLLAYEKSEETGPYSGRGDAKPFLIEGLHLLWQALLLILVYEFALMRWVPSEYQNETAFPFFLSSAYLLNRVLKKSTSFFLCVFGMGVFVVINCAEFSLWQRLQKAGGFAAGIVFFEILLAGLKDKLLFCPVPRPLKGLPILFVTAALLALALRGLFV